MIKSHTFCQLNQGLFINIRLVRLELTRTVWKTAGLPLTYSRYKIYMCASNSNIKIDKVRVYLYCINIHSKITFNIWAHSISNMKQNNVNLEV